VVVVGRGAVVVEATVVTGVGVGGVEVVAVGSVEPAVGAQAEANPMTSRRTTAFFTQAGYSRWEERMNDER
jgi:hypothetical protein